MLLILLALSPLERARELTAALRFKAALEVISPAVVDLAGDERREAVQLQACALMALGRADEAEAAWALLLQVDAEAPGPVGGAPKLRGVYERARARVPLPAPPPKPVIEEAPEPPPPPEPPAPRRPPPLELLPTPVLPPLALTTSPSPEPRWLAWSLSASSAAFLALGTLLAHTALGDSQAAHASVYASDTHALNTRATGAAIGANLLIAGAAVTLVTSVILHLRWR